MIPSQWGSTRACVRERIDEMQIQIAEIRTEVKIQFKEVFARVKRLEAIMIGASASIIAMLVMVLTRMP
jgi:flavorubredoxin